MQSVHRRHSARHGPARVPTREECAALLRDALLHLYDVPYLGSHPLAPYLAPLAGPSALTVGQAVQLRLTDFIEQLRPPAESGASARALRRYRLFAARYLDGLDVAACCDHLGISQTEYYREHRRGIDTLCTLVAGAGLPGQPASAPALPALRLPERTPLVGRTEELALLRALYEAAAAGAGGRAALISGEPGVGKTRLAQEIGRLARAAGGVFLEGRYVREGGSPYETWADALRPELRRLSPDELMAALGPYYSDLAPVLPDLLPVATPAGAQPPRAGEEQRRRLYNGLLGLVLALAQRAPLVLLIDDLQWSPTLGLLVHIARRISDARVLLIGAYREQEFNDRPALVRDWAELNRARLVTELALGVLPEEQTRQMVAHHFGEGPAAELGAAVHRATHGNPYFIEEVLRSLVERGAVQAGPAGWAVAGPHAISLPRSVKLVVEERVDRLGQGTREVLTQAAVLGQGFTLPLLACMTGQPEEAVFDHVDRAVAARLLVDQSRHGVERYAFADDQVQEVLYNGLTPSRRRHYHLQAGSAMEALAGRATDLVLEDLARHFLEGNDPEKGADYAYRAALRADGLFAWARAIPLYRAALEVWEDIGGHLEQRAIASERLGDACFKSTVDAPRAIEHFQQALALYEQLGDRRKVAALHSQIGREYMSGTNLGIADMHRAIAHLERARGILEALPDSLALGLVYGTLANTCNILLRFADGLAWAEREREIGRRLQAGVLLADAAAPLGTALAYTGRVAQGLAMLEEGWRLAVQNAWAYQADYCRAQASMLAIALKDPALGLAWAGRSPDYQTKSSLITIPSMLTAVHTLRGDFAAAQRAGHEAQGRLEAMGLPSHRPDHHGLLLLRSGNWPQARQVLTAAFDRAVQSHSLRGAAAAATHLGELHLTLDEGAEAERRLRWALERARAGGDVLKMLDVLPLLCIAELQAGQIAKAEQWLGEATVLLDGAEAWGGLPTGVALAEGRVRAAQGRWEEADHAFARAAEVARRHALRWDEAQIAFTWAASLPPQQADRARTLYQQARAGWEAIGAAAFAARCVERLAALR